MYLGRYFFPVIKMSKVSCTIFFDSDNSGKQRSNQISDEICHLINGNTTANYPDKSSLRSLPIKSSVESTVGLQISVF